MRKISRNSFVSTRYNIYKNKLKYFHSTKSSFNLPVGDMGVGEVGPAEYGGLGESLRLFSKIKSLKEGKTREENRRKQRQSMRVNFSNRRKSVFFERLNVDSFGN